MTKSPIHSSEQAGTIHPNFVLLLSSLLFLFLVFPCLAVEGHSKRHLLFNSFLIVTQISAIYSVSRNNGSFPLVLLLAVSAVGIHGLTLVVQTPITTVLSFILDILLFAVTTMVILSHVMRAAQIDNQKIMGTVCAYLLIGLIWALVYSLLHTLNPSSFRIDANLLENITIPVNNVAGLPEFIYFSFSTLTTLGYGDVIPVSSTARALASLEALSGQLYLTILVARLVGLHIIQSHTPPDSNMTQPD